MNNCSNPLCGHVLVVDPDQAIRALMRALLQRGGVRVELAASREEAIAAWLSGSYGAVLVEPRMNDGDALLNELYAASRDGRPRIVVVTTPDAKTSTYGTRAGVEAVVLKPFDVQQVSEIVLALLATDATETPAGTEVAVAAVERRRPPRGTHPQTDRRELSCG